MNQPDFAQTLLVVPNGPLIFNHTDGSPLAQFSSVECRETGIFVWTADWSNAVLLMALRMDSQFPIQ
jgi:hypothetical protein